MSLPLEDHWSLFQADCQPLHSWISSLFSVCQYVVTTAYVYMSFQFYKLTFVTLWDEGLGRGSVYVCVYQDVHFSQKKFHLVSGLNVLQ